MEDINKEVTFIDIYGQQLPLIYCKACNKDISTLPHHKSGLCLSCAKTKKLIFNY